MCPMCTLGDTFRPQGALYPIRLQGLGSLLCRAGGRPNFPGDEKQKEKKKTGDEDDTEVRIIDEESDDRNT